MKLKSLFTLGLLVSLAAGCDDETPAESSGGSLVVVANLDSAALADTAKVTVTVTPGELTATFSSDLSASAPSTTFTGLEPGTYVVAATAAAADGTAVVDATATVTIEAGKTAVAALQLGLIGEITVSGLSASDAAPLTSETITLTATLEGDVDSTAFIWSDDCGGKFVSASGATATWRNSWEKDCTITVKAQSGNATDSASVDVATNYAKGTVVTIAGTQCNNSYLYDSDAGDRRNVLEGENGPAVNAKIAHPTRVAIAANGDIYFAERFGGRIDKIEAATGKLIRVAGLAAGSPNSNFGTMGGQADETEIMEPVDLEFSADGSKLYFTDGWETYSIYLINLTSGVITKFAGNTSSTGSVANGTNVASSNLVGGYRHSLAIDSQDNVFYGATYNGNGIGRIYPTTITHATFANTSSDVFDIEVYGNFLYYTSRFNHQIMKIARAGGTPQVIAGDGNEGYSGDGGDATEATLYQPYGLGINPDNGDVFFADKNKAIRRIKASDGTIDTIAGPGKGTLAGDQKLVGSPFGEPRDVEMDADGNLIVADFFGCQIKKIVGPY